MNSEEAIHGINAVAGSVRKDSRQYLAMPRCAVLCKRGLSPDLGETELA